MVTLFFFKNRYGYTGIAFAEFAEAVGVYVFGATQMLLHGITQSTGSFSVYDADTLKMCQIRIIKIFIQNG